MPAEYTYAGTHREKERGGERGEWGGGRQGEREREKERKTWAGEPWYRWTRSQLGLGFRV